MRAQPAARARLIIGIVLVGVAIAVVWGLRQGPPPAKSTPSPTPEGGGHGEQAFNARFVRLTDARETLSYEHADEVVKPDGTVILKARKGEDPPRLSLAFVTRGQPDKLTVEGQRLMYRPEEQAFNGSGGVRMTTGEGLSVETEAVQYQGKSGIAASDGDVTFSRKQISGHSRGLRFDVRLGKVDLLNDVQLTIKDEVRGTVQVTATQGSFDKTSGALELTGNVVVHQGSTHLHADRLLAQVKVPEYTLTGLVATGAVRLSSEGDQLVKQAGLKSDGGRYDLACKRLGIALRPDGSPESMIAGPEGARLAWWPASRQGRERRGLEAAGVILSFDAQGRVEKVVAHKDVRLTRDVLKANGAPKTAAPADTLTCEDMQATLDPQTGEITFGEFNRQVTITRQDQHAKGERAVFERSEFTLTGEPEVVDERAQTRLTAKTIRFGVGPEQGRISAEGGVRHVLQRPGGRGLLGGGQVVVTSNLMSYSSAQQAAMYRSDALLRSGQDEIRAYQIQLRGEEGKRRLVASRRVSTVLHSGKAGAADDEVIRAAAFRVTYEEAEGRITYFQRVEFSRGDLSIHTPESLVALVDGSDALRSLTAGETAVSLQLGERRGEGSQLTYTAANDELRLVGKDGRDAVFADGEGRGVKGPSLTLRRAEDTILVDGLDVQRTSMTIKRGPKKP